MTGGPRPLQTTDHERAAEVAVRSFFSDPGLVWILPDTAQRRRLGVRLATAMIRYARLDGVAEIDADARGLALWFPPDTQPPTEAVLRASGLLDVPGMIGQEAWSRVRGLMADLAGLHRIRNAERHWYLSLLAVDPDFRRQGIGSQLMRSHLSQVDAAGLPCYLLTPLPHNVLLYERRGFRVVAEADAAERKLHLWLMRRPSGG